VAVTVVGAAGITAGTTALDVVPALVPHRFVAVTVKVYETPFVRPVTLQPSDVVGGQVWLPPPEVVTV
jgi:hypothetical protein